MPGDVIVIGGGASGLMCAWQAAARGRSVLVLEKGPKVGLKILVSGGGRCNFTNTFVDPHEHFVSNNEHFCVSALRRFEPADFIALVEQRGIDYHEKTLGQLFCDDSAKSIVALLLDACRAEAVSIRLKQTVSSVRPDEQGLFEVVSQDETYRARQVVVATGGLSLPKVASDFAFQCAENFGLSCVATRPALVPLLWSSADRARFASLAGIATPVAIRTQDRSVEFRESLLFTHKGLSGPAILQASSYWAEGAALYIDWLPGVDAAAWLTEAARRNPQQHLSTALKTQLPKRLVEVLGADLSADAKLGAMHPDALKQTAARLNGWRFDPAGTEGYATAEVTAGGIDTAEVSSKTFAVKKVPGLYVIGEALDVTGWLGGYNFQWAWASGWCCGQHL